MPTWDATLTFFALSVVLGLTPGPDNLFVAMQAATHGRRAGLAVVLGLCTGLLGHTAAVALGLAAVFAASATAFTVFKVMGAAYLAWLAWQAWRAPVGASAGERPPAASWRRLYGRGVFMNLTNPKVALFFLALLPQFVVPGQGPVAAQIAWFGFVFIVATLITFGGITYFAGAFGERLQGSPRAQRWMNRASAVVFAGLALRLATAQR
jgi:threonine/homoserine/homoserine lactone efflux protein